MITEEEVTSDAATGLGQDVSRSLCVGMYGTASSIPAVEHSDTNGSPHLF